MADDTKWYRVILVSGDKFEKAFSTHMYNPETGVRSSMDSGLRYGVNSEWRPEGISACSVSNNRVFLLHESKLIGEHDDYLYQVSEYRWDSSISNLRVVNVLESPVKVWPKPYRTMLFASPSFVLVFADNCEPLDEDQHQLIGRYDVSAKQWDIPPPVPYGNNIHYEQLESSFMCELRWNVSP